MNIKPVASPNAIQQPQATDNRAKAIAAFNQQPQTQVVQNQTQVSAEEMGAIKASTQDENRQGDTNEDTQEDAQNVETQETTAEAPKKIEDPALSRQFAQLAQQEKALRQKAFKQEQVFKAREAELKAKEQSFTQQPKEDMSKYISRDMLKNDALTALAEAGVSYEELTQQILNQQPADPRMNATISKLEAKIAALEQGVETTKKSQADQQSQAYQAAVKQIEIDVKHLVHTDPSFEAIKTAKATKDVVELITETYNKDGILLSVEDAAQQVEDFLVEEYTKYSNINKVKQRMAQSSATKTSNTPEKTQGTSQQKQPQPMKTLTNATSSSRQLSAKERAILAFKGEKF